MNRINFSLLFAAMTVSVVMSAPSLAQDGQKGMGRNMPSFADFDLNGDGVIAETEFYEARAARIAKHAEEGRKMRNLANAPSFDDIDTDDDGSVSPDEFSAHQTEQRKNKAQ
jgi:Ca2+-binding EF-hand superfamily protein